MNFLARLLRGIAYVPAVVHGTEAIFGSKTGASKKDAALDMVSSAVGLTDALANKDILHARILTPASDNSRNQRFAGELREETCKTSISMQVRPA